MEDEPGTIVWLLLGLPVCALLAGTALRWVPRDQRLVVTRGGVVTRVFASRVGVRVPLVEEFVPVSLVPATLPLMVRATTRDGVEVRVLADVTSVALAPRAGGRYVEPWRATQLLLEDVVVRAVSRIGVSELPGDLTDRQDELGREADRSAHRFDVSVQDVQVVEIEVLLTAGRDGRDGRGIPGRSCSGAA